MPDNEQQLMSIEDPYPGEPAPEPADAEEPEPEGTVEVAPGRRMVDVSVVAAERKRARELAAKEVREKELAPLQEKANRADALQQALDTVQPYIQQLQRQTQQPAAPELSGEEQVTDAEAETYARRHQLYDRESKLDLKSAKSIIAEHRQEIDRAAWKAATEATAPLAEATAKERSARNFEHHAKALVGPDGQLMADPNIVVDLWKSLPPELTQHAEVAEIVMDAALGRSQRQKSRGRTVPPPSREPVLSEAPGGRVSHDVTLTETGRKMGLTQTDLKDSAKNFRPGETSPIGSW
jgi:hypothetical protein